MIQAGQLNKCITLQSRSNVADGMGGYTTTWNDEFSPWAAIWPIKAIDVMRTMQDAILITHRVIIRYKSGIKSDWRVKYNSLYFVIVSIINPYEANESLELLCREVAS